MNLAQFVKTLSEASARTAEKTGTKSPFKFYNLNPRQQEKVVRSANYKLGRDPRTIDFDLRDKALLNSIQERMNNYSFMNNLKNGKQIEGYSSILDKKADDFLAANSDKISKDLEEYSTIPLDYEEKSNKVDLSKFTDDEGNTLAENEALDQLFESEGIDTLARDSIDSFTQDFLNANSTTDYSKFLEKYYPELNSRQRLGFIDYINRFDKAKNDPLTTNINDDIVSASESSIMDALNYKLNRENAKNFVNTMNVKFNRQEHDWLQKAIDDYKKDVILRDPSTLPHYIYTIKDSKNIPVNNINKENILDYYNEDIVTPTRLDSLRQMYKNYHNINNEPVESPWKHLKQPENQTRFPPKNPMYKDIYKPVVVKGKYSTFTIPPQPTLYKIAPEETSINLPYNKYSNKAKNISFDPVKQELTQPLDTLDKNVRDELNRTIYKTNKLSKEEQKNKNVINRALYNMTDDEDRLYNTKNLPGLETEIDPYTGNAKNTQYKYADEPHYSKSGNVFDYFDEEDFIRNILESR